MVANKYTSQLLYNYIAQNTSHKIMLRGGKCSCHLAHNNALFELPLSCHRFAPTYFQ